MYLQCRRFASPHVYPTVSIRHWFWNICESRILLKTTADFLVSSSRHVFITSRYLQVISRHLHVIHVTNKFLTFSLGKSQSLSKTWGVRQQHLPSKTCKRKHSLSQTCILPLIAWLITACLGLLSRQRSNDGHAQKISARCEPFPAQILHEDLHKTNQCPTKFTKS